MHNERLILHLDMDAFFASCEQANNPELKSKPVLVSRYDENSIITAASYECRKYGVKAGMPIFQAKKLLKNVEFSIVSSGYDLYEKYSKTVFETIKKNITNKIEIAGLDECYIDATEIWKKYGSISNLCLAIQALIYQKTSLTCSIGASFTKLFAKMASDMNKPNGIKIISKQNFKTIIWECMIDDVIGVGQSLKKITNQLNIYKVIDFVKLDDVDIVKNFGNSGIKMKKALMGISFSKVDYLSSPVKSISKEKTLTLKSKITINDEELKNLLFNLTLNVVYRMKENNVKGKTFHLSIKLFSDDLLNKKRKTYSKTLEEYTDEFETIYSFIESQFNEINNSNYVSLIGVGVSNLVENNKLFKQSKIEF